MTHKLVLTTVNKSVNQHKIKWLKCVSQLTVLFP